MAWMPRACPVVLHVRLYSGEARNERNDPRDKPVAFPGCHGCHGLAPWCFTLVSTPGASRNERNEPRDKPVAWPGCHGLAPWCFTFVSTRGKLETSVTIHGTSP